MIDAGFGDAPAEPVTAAREGSPWAVELRGLTRVFGRVRAVDGLSLRVPRGEIYGFLGPNGSGKTTTLKMLTGLLSPTSGEALVAGEAVRPGEASLELRKRVGFLAEEPAFYPWMTAREFLVFVGRLFSLGAAEADARASTLLQSVDLSLRADDRIRGFSRGMRQRLGIAQALMGDPEVLLLDEPASALDPMGRKEMLDLISSLKGRATIMMSSHILDDVQRVCGWVGIVQSGKLVVEAPLDRLLESYAKPVFHLELAGGRDKLAAALKRERWVREVASEGGGLRILASDPAEAQRMVPALVAGLGARLTEFVMFTPTLEDVFIQLVKER